MTLVGIGTAFAILLLLGLLTALMGRVAARGLETASEPVAPSAEDALAQDRALAAVVAVSLLTARRQVLAQEEDGRE